MFEKHELETEQVQKGCMFSAVQKYPETKSIIRSKNPG